jgi:hypothetical protein
MDIFFPRISWKFLLGSIKPSETLPRTIDSAIRNDGTEIRMVATGPFK